MNLVKTLPLILAAILLCACDINFYISPTPTQPIHPTEQATEYKPQATPTIEATIDMMTPEKARDVAFNYLVDRYGISKPVTWIEQPQEPPTAGMNKYLFTSKEWVVTINAAASAPMINELLVRIDNMAQYTRWEGVVNARGQVRETMYVKGTPAPQS
jgi:hypothetical protein